MKITMLFFFLLYCALLCDGCKPTTDNVLKQNLSNVFIYKKVNVDFKTDGWQFFWGIGSDKVGMPIEAFIHLYAKKDDCIKCISSPQEMAKLKGISILSERDAFCFVRLFTSRNTFVAFSFPGALEYEMQTATIKRTPDGFRITRKLAYPEKANPCKQRLYLVKEKVSFFGIYQLENKTFIRYLSESDEAFPLLE